jgi:hypothetical protein
VGRAMEGLQITDDRHQGSEIMWRKATPDT